MGAATAIIKHQIRTIRAEWDAVCDKAALDPVDKDLLDQRIFFSPFIFEDAPAPLFVNLDRPVAYTVLQRVMHFTNPPAARF